MVAKLIFNFKSNMVTVYKFKCFAFYLVYTYKLIILHTLENINIHGFVLLNLLQLQLCK